MSKPHKKPTLAVKPDKYKPLSDKLTPKPTYIKNTVRAFIVGGVICALGQIIINLFILQGVSLVDSSTAATATMIFLGALLTGLGIYDEIGKYAGAGSIIPVTGFSNSIVAPAMEFKREGYVMGVGAKLFLVAGPVLVYGISTSIVVGIIYYVIH